MNAADIMTPNVITATPDTRVHDIARLMTEHRISAIPIVENGKLVGIVSESDLLRRVETGTAPARGALAELFTSSRTRARDYLKTHSRHARDVMTRGVVLVNTETPLDSIVETLTTRNLKRLPVLNAEGAVVGIISRANIVRALAANPPLPSTADDTAIRTALLAEYDAQGWGADPANVLVEDGIVHLWGSIRAPEIRRAMEVAAENIPGVKSVENHLDEGPLGGDPMNMAGWPIAS